MRPIFLVVLLLTVSPLFHAKDAKAQWNTGKLLSVDREQWTSTDRRTTSGSVDGSGNISATTRESTSEHHSFQVVVDDGQFTYFAERTLDWWQRKPLLTENAEVKWRLDKDKFILLDERGKEFKMKLVKKRKNEPQGETESAPSKTSATN